MQSIALKNELGAAICDNLRRGNWLMDWVVTRLRQKPASQKVCQNPGVTAPSTPFKAKYDFDSPLLLARFNTADLCPFSLPTGLMPRLRRSRSCPAISSRATSRRSCTPPTRPAQSAPWPRWRPRLARETRLSRYCVCWSLVHFGCSVGFEPVVHCMCFRRSCCLMATGP